MANQSKEAAQLFGWLLDDIKTIWDREGFGSDESESEPLYARLVAAIQVCQKAGYQR